MDAGTQVVLLVLAVGLLMVLSAGAAGQRARTQVRLAALERKVDAIAAHLGVPEPRYPEVDRLVDQGQQVAAIKEYREATGADLLTAEKAVDQIARDRR